MRKKLYPPGSTSAGPGHPGGRPGGLPPLSILFAVLVLGCFSLPAAAGVNVWTTTGPYINDHRPAVNCLTWYLNEVYAGTGYSSMDHGLFVTADGGGTWSANQFDIVPVQAARSFLKSSGVPPVFSRVTMLGTNAGLYKQVNGGAWTNEGFSDVSVLRGQYLVDSGRVYRSTNSGGSWTDVTTAGMAVAFIECLAVYVPNNAVAYAGTTTGGVFKTTNGGTSWAPVNTGLPAGRVDSAGVSGSDPNLVYASVFYQGIFRSTDGGGSWSPASGGLPASMTTQGARLVLAVDPANSQILYTGGTDSSVWGTGVYRSIDGGGNWAFFFLAGLVPDTALKIRDILVKDSTHLYAATEDGVYTLQICEPPAITDQPDDVTVCAGQPATLSVTATGTNLAYQWEIWSVLPGGTGFWNNLEGATANSYTNPSPAGTHNYRCVVSNECGTAESGSAHIEADQPAAITAQPAAHTPVCPGGTATLTVTATGTNLRYQWYWEEVTSHPVGDNSNTYSTTVPSLYYVVVSNACGAVESNHVIVETIPPPQITAQPAGATICPGQTATLSVTATGTGLSYQWGYSSICTIETYTPIPGATSSVYNAGQTGCYRVVVQDLCGATATSAEVIVGMFDPPHITTQPVGADICPGQTATLSVAATGTGLTYQWLLGHGTGSEITGATAPAYTANYGGSFQVRVTDQCGAVAYSDWVWVNMNEPPSITTQPQPVNVCTGATATLKVWAAGTNLHYQWYRDETVAHPVGGDSDTYTTTVPSLYYVKVYNICGAVESALVEVGTIAPVQITAQPVSADICPGQPVTLSVTATGTGLSYQWYYLCAGVQQEITGATGPTYIVTTDSPCPFNQYQVVVRDQCGNSVASSEAQVLVNHAPAIQDQSQSDELCQGQQKILTVVADGVDNTYQWQRWDALAPGGGAWMDIPGAATSEYLFHDIVSDRFRCAVTNQCGTTVGEPIDVWVTEHPPVIQVQPHADSYCGGLRTLSVTATGGMNLSYQWQWTSGGEIVVWNDLPSATEETYETAAEGVYRVVVTNACGSTESDPVNLRISTAIPTIATQPPSSHICAGEYGYNEVEATGGALDYRWYQGVKGDTSQPLSSGDHMSVLLFSTTHFWVRVSNACGSVDSETATIQVGPPDILAQPADAQACDAHPAVLTVTADGGDMTYQWQVDWVLPTGHAWHEISGANAATCSITDEGAYRVVVTNDCGSRESQTVQVTSGAAFISGQSSDPSIAVGGTAQLSVTATGIAPIHYAWFAGPSGDTSHPAPGGSDTSTYTTPALQQTTTYWCQADNACDNSVSYSQTFTVHVYSKAGNFSVKGFLGVGLNLPERAIHLRGPNAVFRMDRTQDTAAFLIGRVTQDQAIMKSFLVGVNASPDGIGHLVVSDLGQAASGAGATRMTIGHDGTATFQNDVRARSFAVISSLRFKTDIRPLEGAGEMVSRLRGVNFLWKADGRRDVGLIAEEAAAVEPQLAPGQGLVKNGLDYGRLAVLLVESCKERQQRIENLRGRCLELRELIDRIQSRLAADEVDKNKR